MPIPALWGFSSLIDSFALVGLGQKDPKPGYLKCLFLIGFPGFGLVIHLPEVVDFTCDLSWNRPLFREVHLALGFLGVEDRLGELKIMPPHSCPFPSECGIERWT